MKTPIIAALLIVFVWIGLVFIEFRTIKDIDDHVALILNSRIGYSEVLDLTVLFFSRPAGDLFCVILAAVLIIKLLHDPRKSWIVSTVVVGLFYFSVVALSYGFVDIVDSYVTRPTPAKSLMNYRSPAESLGGETDIPSSSRFPAERVVFFGVVFFVSVFRFGRSGLLLIIPVFLVGMSRIAAGIDWFTDVIGGFICAWLITVAVYTIRLNELFNFLENRAQIIWRQKLEAIVSRAIARAKGADKSPFRSLERLDAKKTASDELSKALPPELTSVLAEKWNLENVTVLAVPHKAKLYPIESNGTRYAFKISRLEEDRLPSLQKAMDVADFLTERTEIRIPRILPRIDNGRIAVIEGKLIYLMEWVKGEPIDTGNTSEVQRLLKMLAIMHRETQELVSEEPIPVERYIAESIDRFRDDSNRGGSSFVSRWSFLTPRNVESVDVSTILADAIRCEQIARLAYGMIDKQSTPPLCYTHVDTHPMNYMIDDEDYLIMLDIDTIFVGPRHKDLISPLRKTLRRHNWETDVFLDLIDAYRSENELQNWEIQLILAELLFPEIIAKMGRPQKNRILGPSKKKRMQALRESIRYNLERGLRIRMALEVADRLGFPSLDGIFRADELDQSAKSRLPTD